MIEASGFEVVAAKHLYDKRGYLAGRDADRLDDFHAMVQDPEIKAVFCARGGYGSMRILNGVRFSLLKENPKILAGYSDVTALLLSAHRKAGLVTFHGPMLRDLEKDGGGNWRALVHLVSSGQPYRLDLSGCAVLSPGRRVGRLIGGNLAMICHLVGTPYLPSLEGGILLVEEVGEPLYRIDRMLTHLALSGHLSGLAGFVAGEFAGCGDEEEIARLIAERLGGLGIPVLFGAPVGHGAKNVAFPIGPAAELDAEGSVLSVQEACVHPTDGARR